MKFAKLVLEIILLFILRALVLVADLFYSSGISSYSKYGKLRGTSLPKYRHGVLRDKVHHIEQRREKGDLNVACKGGD